MTGKKERDCWRCFWGEYHRGGSMMASGWICHKNPFRPVFMGLSGMCSEKTRNIEEQKERRRARKGRKYWKNGKKAK